MRVRPTRGSTKRRTGGAVLMATALLSAVLVTATTGTSGAAPVSTTIPATCKGLDAATNDTLALAKGLIGSDTVSIKLNVTSPDIPATAGLDQPIDAAFGLTATMDQNLIDQAAALIPAINVTDIKAQMLVKGPSDEDSFDTSVPGPITIAPVAGAPANLPLGTIGGPIMTTGGGIITYRVGQVSLKVALSVTGVGDFNLNLGCDVDGSNLIAKTTVKDPDAPTFTPEVVKLDAAANGVVTVDLLKGVISPGKTPLLPESLEIVEQPSAGTASITNGVFSFTAPAQGGTYSTTVQICGAPKAEGGTPGVSEVQKLTLGANWRDGFLTPRPVAFSLKVGDQETALINTYDIIPLGILLFGPLPGDTPSAGNWAPADQEGLVNHYVTKTSYRAPTAAQVQAALEALPNVGLGNVEVTDLKENEGQPDLVTGFLITYKGTLAEQDVPSVSLGQWYTVPPQELLDQISGAITALSGGGDEEEGEPVPLSAFEAFLEPLDGNNPADRDAAGAKFVELFIAGQLADGDAGALLTFLILDPVLSAIPEIVAFLNSLFPQKVATTTAAQGEPAVPPQPLCAQGIIDVTVTEVASATATNPTAVAGTSATRGIGFVG